MYLSGQETQQMLDYVAARSSERGCRTQAQVSGIYFDMVCGSDDTDCNARQDAQGLPHGPCAKNIWLGDACRDPDGSFTTQEKCQQSDHPEGCACQPLAPFGEYRVAVHDYIANGGSGFTVLKRNTTKFNTGISLRDALIDYVRNLPNRCDPAQYSNITGVACRDSSGETFDCSQTCCCHDDDSGPNRCSSKCDKFLLCSAGVVCKDSMGKSYDCTQQCCGHDQASGAAACSASAPAFVACQQAGLRPTAQFMSPQPYDYSNVACLDQVVEAHDGRIQAIGGGGSSMENQ
jgi:hypothetical protein